MDLSIKTTTLCWFVKWILSGNMQKILKLLVSHISILRANYQTNVFYLSNISLINYKNQPSYKADFGSWNRLDSVFGIYEFARTTFKVMIGTIKWVFIDQENEDKEEHKSLQNTVDELSVIDSHKCCIEMDSASRFLLIVIWHGTDSEEI